MRAEKEKRAAERTARPGSNSALIALHIQNTNHHRSTAIQWLRVSVDRRRARRLYPNHFFWGPSFDFASLS
jgi:hypothetical protein